MWFIGVEVEQETSAPPPKKNPGSAPANCLILFNCRPEMFLYTTKAKTELKRIYV